MGQRDRDVIGFDANREFVRSALPPSSLFLTHFLSLSITMFHDEARYFTGDYGR